MCSWKAVQSKIRRIVQKIWKYGVDRNWQSWHKVVWPQIVEAGPPADLTEKESREANFDTLAQMS